MFNYQVRSHQKWKTQDFDNFLEEMKLRTKGRPSMTDDMYIQELKKQGNYYEIV